MDARLNCGSISSSTSTTCENRGGGGLGGGADGGGGIDLGPPQGGPWYRPTPLVSAPTNQCSGSVRTLGVHVALIAGLGLTFDAGRATVNKSGVGQWYFSIG